MTFTMLETPRYDKITVLFSLHYKGNFILSSYKLQEVETVLLRHDWLLLLTM